MEKATKKAEELAAYAQKYLGLDARDVPYVRNRVLEIFERCEGELSEEERDEVYGALSMPPSAVNAEFQRLVKEDSRKATD